MLPSLCVSPQAAWPPGTECVAKYNFQGTTGQDLPFFKGDVLTIIGVTKVRNEGHDTAHTIAWMVGRVRVRVKQGCVRVRVSRCEHLTSQ